MRSSILEPCEIFLSKVSMIWYVSQALFVRFQSTRIMLIIYPTLPHGYQLIVRDNVSQVGTASVQ